MEYLTLSEENQFSFVCPVFDSKVTFRSCRKLRDMVWRGVRVDVRRGCQACMVSGMCPAAEVIQRMAMSTNLVPDDYGSETPVIGKIRAEVLGRVSRVMVLESTMARYEVPELERSLIASFSTRVDALLERAPAESSPRKSSAEGKTPRKRKPVSVAPVEEQDDIKKAAQTGDLSAAIRKDIQE